MSTAKTLKLFTVHFLLIGSVWLLLTDFNLSSFFVGTFFVLAASAISFFLHVSKEHQANHQIVQIRFTRLPGFVLFFLLHSLRGGVDVARKAIQKQVTVRPGFQGYSFHQLPPGRAQDLFCSVVSLLPGTLSAEQSNTSLTIHFLHEENYSQSALQALEYRVCYLFGLDKTIGEQR